MILGFMTDTYLTGVRSYGEPWRVTHHTVIVELHATKGWRPIQHHRRTRTVTERISPAEWRAADTRVFRYADGRPARLTNSYGVTPLQVRP